MSQLLGCSSRDNRLIQEVLAPHHPPRNVSRTREVEAVAGGQTSSLFRAPSLGESACASREFAAMKRFWLGLLTFAFLCVPFVWAQTPSEFKGHDGLIHSVAISSDGT